jgi:hypothetical protein
MCGGSGGSGGAAPVQKYIRYMSETAPSGKAAQNFRRDENLTTHVACAVIRRLYMYSKKCPLLMFNTLSGILRRFININVHGNETSLVGRCSRRRIDSAAAGLNLFFKHPQEDASNDIIAARRWEILNLKFAASRSGTSVERIGGWIKSRSAAV